MEIDSSKGPVGTLKLVHGLKENVPLDKRSKQIRRDVIALSKANGGYHYGGSFSVSEILITLFDRIITDEDKVILSKGHSCWPLYVLLRERGLNPELGGHPSFDQKNGLHCTTGSEGHGLPMGMGMAWGKELKKEKGHVYVVMGDGECQEGTTWESLLTGVRRKFEGVTAIIDYNNIQGAGYVSDILPMDKLPHIASLLGWCVDEVNGHSTTDLYAALTKRTLKKPRLVFCHTVKGKGVSYMENVPAWHAKWPDEDHEKWALKELE